MSPSRPPRTSFVVPLLILAVLGLAATVALLALRVRQIGGPLVARSFGDAPRAVPVAVSPRGDLAESEKSTIDLFRRSSPSVVYITTLSVREDPFRRNATAIPSGTGSGFVWDEAGHVVTNFHVIREADAARVTLSDGSVWPAELAGASPEKDVAVLLIKAPRERLNVLPVGTSRDLAVGQAVFAIGNPFGLDHTLSTGVVSGLGREIESAAKVPIQDVIQTDAAINPGNSGGPLLDSAGRLIGINTAIYSPSGASAGVGFAVPVDTVLRVVPQIIEHGRVIRPGLGVRLADPAFARRAGVEGIIVMAVQPGQAADKAGIQGMKRDARTGQAVLGDVIVAVDGQPVTDAVSLYKVLDRHEVGQTVQVRVTRDGARDPVELPVTLAPLVD